MTSKTGLDDWDDPSEIGCAAASTFGSGHPLGCADTSQTALGLLFKAVAVCCTLTAQAALSASPVPNPSSTNDVDRLGHVTLSGDVPINEFPNIQQESDQIWSYLTRRLNVPHHHPLPVIHFDPFDRNVQSSEWSSLCPPAQAGCRGTKKMLTRLTGARVYDPANGVRGEVRDIWVEDTHICTTPPHPSAAARTIDLSGKVLMAGAIDIHSHIAGGNVNTARVLMPEQHVAATRRYGKLAFSGAKWSAFDTGYRYAEMVDTIGAADGMPMHLAHIQFYGYGGEGERGFSLPPITRTAPHLRPTRSCSAC